VLTYRTKLRVRAERADPESLERGVRQLLADKISGTMAGLWLLVPEHLRLGTWDLLRAWTAHPTERVEPRLALQLVHEAALCVRGIRQGRCLSQKGFELANGLPFVGSDQAIHQLLDAHTVVQAQELQVALGLVRRARGHFPGHLLAIDPHRMPSSSKRQMRLHRSSHKQERKAHKCSPTFFALDAQSGQPVCLLTGTASRTASHASAELLPLAQRILQPLPGQILTLADSEHFTLEIFQQIVPQTPFDLLVPMPQQPYYQRQFQQIPPEAFVPRWAGLAIAKIPLPNPPGRPPLYQLVQRLGEQPARYLYKGFWSTADRDELQDLIVHFPQRWHIEEFFHDHEHLGWNRGGTLNLHIRYGQMTLALVAQAALYQLRQRLGSPYDHWQADHLAEKLLAGLDGDIRVHGDTILVTYYNAPDTEKLRPLYEGLPAKLQTEGLRPNIPWLYDFKLDFRFR